MSEISLLELRKGERANIIGIESGMHPHTHNHRFFGGFGKHNHHPARHSARHRNFFHNEGVSIAESRLESLGIREGKIIEILVNDRFGPLMVKVEGNRIALGRGMASKVIVKKQEDIPPENT